MKGTGRVKVKGQKRSWVIPALFFCFFSGGIAGWWLHAAGAPVPAAAIERTRPDRERAVATTGKTSETVAPTRQEVRAERAASTADPIADLRAHDPRLPIDDADIEKLKGGFDERRDGGGRGHEAVDILAPRNTPIHAAEDGTIAKLFYSKAGGNTIYQFDPTGRFSYYYAHLEHYAKGLHDGQRVSKGEVIGYVGTTGNAPPGTPHLHLAVFELTPERHWWDGKPLDPYEIFKK
jgi:murein DD-endopeptidase MepM/ murein hydrolase activator NlpD